MNSVAKRLLEGDWRLPSDYRGLRHERVPVRVDQRRGDVQLLRQEAPSKARDSEDGIRYGSYVLLFGWLSTVGGRLANIRIPERLL